MGFRDLEDFTVSHPDHIPTGTNNVLCNGFYHRPIKGICVACGKNIDENGNVIP